ncbi:hypothetical protein MPRS_21010 [Mycobacterium paraseoulense]|nr:hypothetical protein MPRS_21010 [Mycobacterium paraseoulense]
MGDQLRDIRELAGDSEAYRDELYRRWTGLLSYRYIGRKHLDGPRRGRRHRHHPPGHAHSRGISGSWHPWPCFSPEGCQTDMVAVPNPVIASVQIIDPGYDVNRVEILGSGLHRAPGPHHGLHGAPAEDRRTPTQVRRP